MSPASRLYRRIQKRRRGLLRRACAAAAVSCLGIGSVPAQSPAAPATTQGSEGGLAEARERARRVAALLGGDEFVAIPPGAFTMGCAETEGECARDERPAHQVTITSEFEIARHEITQELWQSVMGNNPSTFKGSDRPVEQVSWDDVQEFLAALNGLRDGYRYRLPTEAEWEYAARAGTTGEYYGDLDVIAWYGPNAGNETHPVGRKQPNAWGLYDTHGNVWEWCQDWYQEDSYRKLGEQPAVDPQGPANGEYRVVRGGSWYMYLWFVRVSSRLGVPPGSRYPHIGFRCVRQKRS